MNTKNLGHKIVSILVLVSIFSSFYLGSGSTPAANAAHTADPSSVTIAGSLQSELGCPGDWQPECALTNLIYDSGDDVWQATFQIPAGNWEYKAALNGTWTENYGANAQAGGANISLNLGTSNSVKFYYDHKSHWITSNKNAVIATVPGSYQSQLGCGGDWDPSCLRSWLQDPDGNGVYSFTTKSIPPGNYEAKVTIDEGWAENYGQGGEPNGPNIPFSIPVANSEVTFSYDAISHVLTIQVVSGTSVTLVGNLQSELGCAGDWDPTCTGTYLDYDAEDDVFQKSFVVPVGSYEYKVALNNSWAENYGKNAQRDGPNIPLAADGASTKFYFDPKSHWITDNKSSVIAVAPGSFQSELGCNGDWDPSCLRSWLQDIDGDGTYTFETTALPAGNYEAKVAISESWNVNYGAGGVQNGSNIPFFVPFDNSKVTFKYHAATHILIILAGYQLDDDIAWDGLRHDSRDLLYRSPAGAVPAGTAVSIRLRTFHNDVSAVKMRVYDINANGQRMVDMHPAATDVSCYQAGLEMSTCDFWEATLDEPDPNNLWYRFLVTDGSDTDYYADNTSALDGGLGKVTNDVIDQSYALMFYDPEFEAPSWASDAVIYQIFPDRFRNGRKNNDAITGDVRYDDPVLALPWGTLPEGYCRNYADGSTNCPWRFDDTPPDWSPIKEGPRGRDYFGGDLKGVDQYLDYLQTLGVNTIYFNPIFDAGSNHSYDTQDYYKIDPYFGTQKDWENLVKHASQRGMRIVLDGVFNHLSSDSPFFDRYHHYPSIGACESVNSLYRSWFYFQDVPLGRGPCVGSDANHSATYTGWFGFDSIPVINKTLDDVKDYFLRDDNSVSRYWLNKGAMGWRMDVMGDPSFPAGYWETFREVVKGTEPEAFIISETWQKDSTLLRMLRGDRADTTMNYRLRDAILGLLSPGPFDSKGFADSGRVISPSEFADRILSIREDTPDAAYYTMMNLVGSHDTERILWAMTPGSENRADKELNAANLTAGKLRQQMVALIQFSMPGAPTIFYGDEVGITGDDDPDDRRTYPWSDLGGAPDTSMFSFYQLLAILRKQNPVLTDGDIRILLADNNTEVVAYGRKTADQAAVVIVNRSNQMHSGDIPVAGYLPDGLVLNVAASVGSGGLGSVVISNGGLSGEIGPNSAVLLLSGSVDLQPPASPDGLVVTNEGDTTLDLAWNNVPEAAGYNLYRSVVSGGGWIKVNADPLSNTNFSDTGLRNATEYWYVVTSLDANGNESDYSNQASGLPHYSIGWANLQWPPSINHTISAVNRTDTVYGQVWIDGVTNQPGATPTLWAQLGYGPSNSSPAGNPSWVWIDANFNVDAGNNDEFKSSILPEMVGTFDYAFRYSTTNGRDWLYADLDGIGNGYDSAQAGKLTVIPSNDTTPPVVPQNLYVVSASPAGVELAWDAVAGDPTLYGYEVFRGDVAGGPYNKIALVTNANYLDLDVLEGANYYYIVRSVDFSFNRSGYSTEVNAYVVLRKVTVVFNVTVPDNPNASGKSVYIAGTLNRLEGNLPEWNPGGVVLEQVDATHWTLTLTGYESTQIEYKYTLGSWDFVEKGAACDEISNRQLILNFGSNGIQIVNEIVLNWRNIAPCGG